MKKKNVTRIICMTNFAKEEEGIKFAAKTKVTQLLKV